MKNHIKFILNICISLILTLLLTQCKDVFKDTRRGDISTILSKPGQIAITDGRDVYLVKNDTQINRVKFIYFNELKYTKLANDTTGDWQTDYFTVYNITSIGRRYGGSYNDIYVTNGDISTILDVTTGYVNDRPIPVIGDTVFVFYKKDVIFKTYKVQS